MKQGPVTEEWNGKIVDVWDKPAQHSKAKGVPITDLWTTVYKIQPNDNADTRKD